MDRKINCIIIEDDIPLREAFREALERDPNITVKEAGDIEQGGRLARQEPQVVVLADLGLPDGRGIDVINVVRHENPGAVIVVITGDERIKTEALAAGADHVIIKATIESFGDGLIKAVRDAVDAHEIALIHEPALTLTKSQASLIERARAKIE